MEWGGVGLGLVSLVSRSTSTHVCTRPPTIPFIHPLAERTFPRPALPEGLVDARGVEDALEALHRLVVVPVRHGHDLLDLLPLLR